MLTIRASDYYSISYDAAAQNRIDQLEGNTYDRYLESKTVSVYVSEVSLVRTGERVTLPYTKNRANARPGYYTVNNSTFPIEDYGDGVYLETNVAYYPFNAGAGTVVQLGEFDVTFSDLNLPEAALDNLSFEVSYTSVYKALVGGIHLSSENTTGANERAKTEYWQQLWRDTPEKSGSWGIGSWETVYVAGLTKEDHGPYDLNIDRNTYYASYQRSYEGTPFQAGASESPAFNDNIETGNSLRPAVWTGIGTPAAVWATDKASGRPAYATHVDFREITMSVQDRNTVKGHFKFPIFIEVFGNSDWTASSGVYRHICNYLKNITVTLRYLQTAYNEQPFKYTHEGSKGEYPYKFDGESLANSGDNVAGTPWSSYYPNQIFDRYAKGKYYIQLRVRAKFMLLNDARIDTEVQIYDLRGRLISRNGTPCKFKIKRIIKTFDHGEFTYTINCLEE